jgi:hypothetical protein
MDEVYATRKYEADKIVLLALFALGLLIAYFMASARYGAPAAAGAEIVEQIKNKGIGACLDERGWRAYYLIKDAANRTIGFTTDVFANSTSQTGLNIQSADLLYIAGTYSRQSLQTDDAFDQFRWDVWAKGRRRMVGTRMVMDEDGVLTVTKLGRKRTETHYKPGPAAIPEYLAGLVFEQMLETEYDKAIFDIIDSEGRMLEMIVLRVKVESRGRMQTEVQYEFKVDFPDQPGHSQQISFDDQGRIAKVLIEQRGMYFERSSPEAVLRKFPKWADYILYEDKLLGQEAEQHEEEI